MIVSPSVKLRSEGKRRGRSINGDQLVRRRGGKLFVINKLKPRNKQRQG